MYRYAVRVTSGEGRRTRVIAASVLHYINVYGIHGVLSRTYRRGVAARKGLTIRVAASIYGP